MAILSVITFTVSSMMMVSYISQNGEKINYVWIRFMIFSYMSKYREITRKLTGRTGKLFYLGIISINLALVFVVLRFIIY